MKQKRKRSLTCFQFQMYSIVSDVSVICWMQSEVLFDTQNYYRHLETSAISFSLSVKNKHDDQNMTEITMKDYNLLYYSIMCLTDKRLI